MKLAHASNHHQLTVRNDAFEPRLPESESDVLTVTQYDDLMNATTSAARFLRVKRQMKQKHFDSRRRAASKRQRASAVSAAKLAVTAKAASARRSGV